MKLRFLFMMLVVMVLTTALTTDAHVSKEAYNKWYEGILPVYSTEKPSELSTNQFENGLYCVVLLEGAFNYDKEDAGHLKLVGEHMGLQKPLNQQHIKMMKVKLEELLRAKIKAEMATQAKVHAAVTPPGAQPQLTAKPAPEPIDPNAKWVGLLKEIDKLTNQIFAELLTQSPDTKKLDAWATEGSLKLGQLEQFYADHKDDLLLLKKLALDAKEVFGKKLKEETPANKVPDMWRTLLDEFKVELDRAQRKVKFASTAAPQPSPLPTAQPQSAPKPIDPKELTKQFAALWKEADDLDENIDKERKSPAREFTSNRKIAEWATQGLQKLAQFEKFYVAHKQDQNLLKDIAKQVSLRLHKDGDPVQAWNNAIERYRDGFSEEKKTAESAIAANPDKEKRLALEPEDPKEFYAKWVALLNETDKLTDKIFEEINFPAIKGSPDTKNLDAWATEGSLKLGQLEQFYADHKDDLLLLKTLGLNAKEAFKGKKLRNETPADKLPGMWQTLLKGFEDILDTAKEKIQPTPTTK